MIADGVETGRRRTAAPDAAGWLGLAASPTFAAMAFATAASGAGPLDVLCAAGGGPFALSGMTPMYLLMSVFHAGPWLKLAARAPFLKESANRLR